MEAERHDPQINIYETLESSCKSYVCVFSPVYTYRYFHKWMLSSTVWSLVHTQSHVIKTQISSKVQFLLGVITIN